MLGVIFYCVFKFLLFLSYEEALRDGVNINHTSGGNHCNSTNTANNSRTSYPALHENGQQQISALPVSESVIATAELDETAAAVARAAAVASGGVISTSQISTMTASHILYACANSNNMSVPTSCTNTHPHYRQSRYSRPSSQVSKFIMFQYLGKYFSQSFKTWWRHAFEGGIPHVSAPKLSGDQSPCPHTSGATDTFR